MFLWEKSRHHAITANTAKFLENTSGISQLVATTAPGDLLPLASEGICPHTCRYLH